MLLLLSLSLTLAAPAETTGSIDDPVVEEVVVTADGVPTSLSQTVVASQVIAREQIEASGAVTLDQLLETIPGIQLVAGPRGDGLALRGHDPRHTLILIDGRRVLGRINGAIDLRRYSVDSIERIEVVRGPTSAIHGADAMGGVIQIITRTTEDDWFAEFNLMAGGYPGEPLDSQAIFVPDSPLSGLDNITLEAAAGISHKATTARASLSAQGWDGWDRTPEDLATTGDSQQLIAPNIGITTAFGGQELTLDLAGMAMKGLGIDGTMDGPVDRTYATQTWDAGLRGVFSLPHRVHLYPALSFSSYQDRYQASTEDPIQDTDERLLRADLRADAWVDKEMRHRIQGGSEVFFQTMRTTRLVNDDASRVRGAVHAQHTWRITDSIPIVLQWGGRVELDSLFGVFPTPRIAIKATPIRTLQIRVAGGLGFRAPDFKQLYLNYTNANVNYQVQGNPDLRPEQSWGVTSDIEWASGGVYSVLSGWHDQLTNLITFDIANSQGGRPIYSYINIGNARIRGLTAEIGWAKDRPFSGQVSWTFTDGRNVDTGDRLPGQATHQGTASFTLRSRVPNITARVGLTALGPRTLSAGDADAITTQWVPLVDTRISWQASKNLQIYAGIDNLFDAGRGLFDATRPARVYGGLRTGLGSGPS